MTWTRRRSPHGSPHGLAWRQPFFMALTGGYPVLAGSLLLTIAGPQPKGNPMESNTLHRGRLIDHILLVVEDFEASKNFYTAVLSALEIPVITTANEYLLADELVVASRHSPEAAGKLTGRHHLAFQARDRDMVDAFYHAALTHGGRDNGAPGERHYHPGYYAAFVLDPQGNNIEAVYHGEAERSAGSVAISFTQ